MSSRLQMTVLGRCPMPPGKSPLELVSATTSVEWAAVARIASRQVASSGWLPQLTMSRSRPMLTSSAKVPAWAARSNPPGGGAPLSTITVKLAGGEPLESRLRRLVERLRRVARRRQHQLDMARALLVAAVEERKPAIAMLQEAHHRRHDADRPGDRSRHRLLAPREGPLDLAEIGEHRELAGGAAFDMDAIGQDLAGELALDDLEPAPAPRATARQSEPGEQQRLRRGDQRGARELGRQRPTEPGGFLERGREQPRAEGRIGAGEQPVGMQQPLREAFGPGLRRRRGTGPGGWRRDPALDQDPGAGGAGLAGGGEVGEPAEAVQVAKQAGGGARRVPAGLAQDDEATAADEAFGEHRGAGFRVAEPEARADRQDRLAHPPARSRERRAACEIGEAAAPGTGDAVLEQPVGKRSDAADAREREAAEGSRRCRALRGHGPASSPPQAPARRRRRMFSA